jgi:hypothetical protein
MTPGPNQQQQAIAKWSLFAIGLLLIVIAVALKRNGGIGHAVAARSSWCRLDCGGRVESFQSQAVRRRGAPYRWPRTGAAPW